MTEEEHQRIDRIEQELSVLRSEVARLKALRRPEVARIDRVYRALRDKQERGRLVAGVIYPGKDYHRVPGISSAAEFREVLAELESLGWVVQVPGGSLPRYKLTEME